MREETRALRAACAIHEEIIKGLERELVRRGGDLGDVGAAPRERAGDDPFGKVRELCGQMGEAVMSVCDSLSQETTKQLRCSWEKSHPPGLELQGGCRQYVEHLGGARPSGLLGQAGS